MRRYPEPTPPAEAILPTNKDESAIWAEASAAGWEKGVKQADILHEANMALLVNTLRGMINYRILVAQGVMEPIQVEIREGGIRVEDNFVNIGEIVYETVAPATFKPYPEWQQVVPEARRETRLRGSAP